MFLLTFVLTVFVFLLLPLYDDIRLGLDLKRLLIRL